MKTLSVKGSRVIAQHPSGKRHICPFPQTGASMRQIASVQGLTALDTVRRCLHIQMAVDLTGEQIAQALGAGEEE